MLVAWRQLEGKEVKGSMVRNAPRGSVVGLGNEAPLFSGAQGVGLPSLPHTSPCHHGHWEGLPLDRAHPSLLQLPSGLCCLRHFMHTPIVAALCLPSLSE